MFYGDNPLMGAITFESDSAEARYGDMTSKTGIPPRLAQYIGARATLYYMSQNGVSDSGVITYMDDHWVELTKDGGERLLTPIPSIRIIKMIEPALPPGDPAILLRAADVIPPTQKKAIPK